MASHPYVLAFDLGGEKLRAAAFDLDGRRLGQVQALPLMGRHPAALTLLHIKRAGAQAAKWAGREGAPRAVGMGCAGSLDPRRGRLIEPARLPRLADFDMALFIRREFSAPLFLLSDGACLALVAARGAGEESVLAGAALYALDNLEGKGT